MKKQKRSLYQCFNARVREGRMCCAQGHEFPKMKTSILMLERGDPLELTCCQDCPDYDEMGDPVAKEDRGWLNIETKEVGNEGEQSSEVAAV